jgi:hypothetical protein
MKNIDLADVAIHIDEKPGHLAREQIEKRLRGLPGVVSATSHDETPHLLIVEYNPADVDSQAILACVRELGVHAELIGL